MQRRGVPLVVSSSLADVCRVHGEQKVIAHAIGVVGTVFIELDERDPAPVTGKLL
jgi:hypothetical protein